MTMQFLMEEENVFNEGEKVTEKVVPTQEAYFKPESGFGIYVVELENGVMYTMKGKFPGSLKIGSTYEVEADVVRYRGEMQLHAQKIQVARAQGRRAVVFYLQTLKGLKSRAEVIYDVFGEKTLDIMMNKPELVAQKVRGIGKKTTAEWAMQLKEKMHEEELLLFLFELGLNPAQVEVLTGRYGATVRKVLEDNPYRLIQDVRGYGFKKCDAIAEKTGIAFDDLKRVRAGVIYVYQGAVQEGHTYLTRDVLAERMKQTLSTASQTISDTLIQQGIDEMLIEEEIVEREDRVYLTRFDEWEDTIVREAIRLSKKTPWKRTTQKDVEDALEDYIAATGIHLEAKQREAVIRFCSEKAGFFILNGSAGCGKTFTLKVILEVLKIIHRRNHATYQVKVMAPTGKASKVASRATGLPCVTIHNGLEFNPEGGFDRNESNPLEETVIVADETSMLDTEICKDLLLAIANGAKVIFMGDTKQLPSVGPGNVLKDLINSNIVEVVTLDVVKRQGKDSGINENANRIIAMQMVETQKTADAFVISTQSEGESLRKLVMSTRRLMELGYELNEIQVLSPMRKGELGTFNLNRIFQEQFNPDGAPSPIKNVHIPFEDGELFFRKGDKVIHLQNDKERPLHAKKAGRFVELPIIGITNGECGVVEDFIEREDYDMEKQKTVKTQRLIVRYEDWYVFYDAPSDFEMLDHAYALTIHKSQGSQWKAVLQPIANGHLRMLDNNLLYTGETRAELFHAFIGSIWALRKGIETQRSDSRFTGLGFRFGQMNAK